MHPEIGALAVYLPSAFFRPSLGRLIPEIKFTHPYYRIAQNQGRIQAERWIH